VGWDRLGRPPVIAVGRDNRPSGGELADGVRRGIVEAGGSAVDVGIVPTPALYFAVKSLGTDGGVQVTGSSGLCAWWWTAATARAASSQCRRWRDSEPR
jgi:hypothetical protein